MLASACLSAQSNSTPVSPTLPVSAYYPLESCNTARASDVQQFLESQCHCTLRLVHTASTGHSITYRFVQTASGMDLYSSYIQAGIINHSNAFSVSGQLFRDLPAQTATIFGTFWFNTGDAWVMVKRHTEFDRDALHQWEIFTDNNGKEVHRYDAALHAGTVDSTVRVRVFNTDPLTSAHKTYTAPYLDYNDSDVAVLNAERQWKRVKCSFSNDTFTIGNQYLVSGKWNNFTSYDPVYKVHDTVFDYTRHQHEFEDVMVLYHVTEFRQYMASLGMANIGFMPIVFDAHATKEDNSAYMPGWGLVFGTGGIDDAEDAEVIVHEYTHSLREFLAPATNIGDERAAIEEGTCDYIATSYKIPIDSFGWRKFAYWDGNNPAANWYGRDVASKKIYPQALTTEMYQNSELWSSALMRIYFKLGKTVTDKLVMEFISYLSPNLSMPDAARLVMRADTALYGGVNAGVIQKTFQETHILPWLSGITPNTHTEAPVQVLNTSAFSSGTGPLRILNTTPVQGNYTLCSITGATLQSGPLMPEETKVSPDGLPPGIYILSIFTPEGNTVMKVIR